MFWEPKGVEPVNILTEEWADSCLEWHGVILVGKYAHWCLDWDELPIDESCAEFMHCNCFVNEEEVDKLKKEIREKYFSEMGVDVEVVENIS